MDIRSFICAALFVYTTYAANLPENNVSFEVTVQDVTYNSYHLPFEKFLQVLTDLQNTKKRFYVIIKSESPDPSDPSVTVTSKMVYTVRPRKINQSARTEYRDTTGKHLYDVVKPDQMYMNMGLDFVLKRNHPNLTSLRIIVNVKDSKTANLLGELIEKKSPSK